MRLAGGDRARGPRRGTGRPRAVQVGALEHGVARRRCRAPTRSRGRRRRRRSGRGARWKRAHRARGARARRRRRRSRRGGAAAGARWRRASHAGAPPRRGAGAAWRCRLRRSIRQVAGADDAVGVQAVAALEALDGVQRCRGRRRRRRRGAARAGAWPRSGRGRRGAASAAPARRRDGQQRRWPRWRAQAAGCAAACGASSARLRGELTGSRGMRYAAAMRRFAPADAASRPQWFPRSPTLAGRRLGAAGVDATSQNSCSLQDFLQALRRRRSRTVPTSMAVLLDVHALGIAERRGGEAAEPLHLLVGQRQLARRAAGPRAARACAGRGSAR